MEISYKALADAAKCLRNPFVNNTAQLEVVAELLEHIVAEQRTDYIDTADLVDRNGADVVVSAVITTKELNTILDAAVQEGDLTNEDLAHGASDDFASGFFTERDEIKYEMSEAGATAIVKHFRDTREYVCEDDNDEDQDDGEEDCW